MKHKLSIVTSSFLIVGLLSFNLAMAGVTPDLVEETMEIGTTSAVINKVVTTPEIPPNPDIVFLADTTGSMGAAIANVQANSSAIMASVLAAQPTAQFGAAEYRDVGSAPLFAINQAVTAVTADVNTAIGTWDASGGGDLPEAQLNALFELGTDVAGVGYRTGSTRIVVWFGDASGHDPSNGQTQATAIAALNAAGVRVIAVPVPGGDGLDATGQATAITAATGGVLLAAATAGDVATAILTGLGNLSVTVSWVVDGCAPELNVTLAPASQTVTSGDDALFTETIEVANDPALMGTTQSCVVHFVDENGNNLGDEEIVVHIPDTIAPKAACVPTTNPAGKKVPTAPAKGLQGQNQDGFYQLLGSDNVGVASIVVVDSVPSFISGLFASGDKVKITQAPGVTPSDTRPGPGVIASHLKLKGDAIVRVTDAAGNSTDVTCLVPPKPQ